MGKVFKVVAAIAIAVAIAALAVPTGGLSLAVAGALGVSATVASAIVATTLSLIAGFAMQAVAGRPSVGRPAPLNFRQSISNSFIIMGKRRAGGLMVFFHPRKILTDHFRYFAFASAGHRCQGVTKWYLNDEEVTVSGTLVTSGKYANAAWLWEERGEYDCVADPTFIAECDGKWTEDHRGQGIAKIFAKFKMTKDVVQAGMPTISAEWEGSDEIYDYRTDTEGYSDNAINCFYWWMRLPREEGGFGISDDEVPDPELLSAWANICDEDVSIPGGTEKRYTFNSLIETGAAPSEVRRTFVDGVAGTFTYAEGQHRLRPGYWNPPSTNLSEDDLAGPLRIKTMLEGDEVANEVQATYFDPTVKYQAQPVPTRSVEAASIRQIQLDMPHNNSPWRGQRIAEIMLRRAQCERRVTWPMNIMGLDVEAMQSVMIDTARFNMSNYAWVVDTWNMSNDYSVVLGLREENEDIYADITYLEPSTPPSPDEAEAVPDEDVEALSGTVTTLGGTVTDLDGVVTDVTTVDLPDIYSRLAALETP